MRKFRRSVYNVVTACALVTLVVFTSLSLVSNPVGAATAPPELSLNVLLIGTGSTDPTTAAWESALTDEGVAYTEVTATGTYGAETVTLPALTTGTVGNFNGVVIADSPAGFACGPADHPRHLRVHLRGAPAGRLHRPLHRGRGRRLVHHGCPRRHQRHTDGGRAWPGCRHWPDRPFATGTYGYPATVDRRSPLHPVAGEHRGRARRRLPAPEHRPPGRGVRAGAQLRLQRHPLQWELLAPGLINWVTHGTHFGLDRNYVEMDIDDTFTPDNAWSTTVHDNDYSDADSQRMDAADVITPADWSNPTQENGHVRPPVR